MLAVATVHTSGINWESISVIGGFIVAVAAYITRLINRNNDRLRVETVNAVENLGLLLVSKLESKEAVAKISERLVAVETELHDRKDGRNGVARGR